MNIDNLKQARDILRRNLEVKLTGTKNLSLLIDAINSLDILIKRLEEPAKAEKLDKLCNG